MSLCVFLIFWEAHSLLNTVVVVFVLQKRSSGQRLQCYCLDWSLLTYLFVVSWLSMVEAVCIFSGRVTQQYHYVPSGKEPSVNLQGFTLPQPTEGVVGQPVCRHAYETNKGSECNIWSTRHTWHYGGCERSVQMSAALRSKLSINETSTKEKPVAFRALNKNIWCALFLTEQQTEDERLGFLMEWVSSALYGCAD